MKITLAIVSAMLLLPSSVDAQMRSFPSTSLPGITVIGHATIHLAINAVRFQASVQGTVDESSALDAMRSAGIDDAAIGTNGQIFPGSSTMVRGIIHHATRAKLNAVGKAMESYIAAHSGVHLNSVTLTAASGECDDKAEHTVRAQAIVDARRKAASIASSSGIGLGAVTSIAETGGCPLGDDQAMVSSQQFDSGTLMLTVPIFETVTYSIANVETSRRRPS